MIENTECGETTDFWIMPTKTDFIILPILFRIKYA